ncbi:uncharacterized protein LOC120471096 [Pimephales promelas]|uniref:uncharacterized protein LOC120471096 n=1 Tax=Pimephales promelas TaxID=90988 RepID=UPI001955BCE5|nr:uncharacterized protein LOC120471096 [Pimephales promelas]
MTTNTISTKWPHTLTVWKKNIITALQAVIASVEGGSRVATRSSGKRQTLEPQAAYSGGWKKAITMTTNTISTKWPHTLTVWKKNIITALQAVIASVEGGSRVATRSSGKRQTLEPQAAYSGGWKKAITMTTAATSIKWARTHTVLKKDRITALQAAIASVEGGSRVATQSSGKRQTLEPQAAYSGGWKKAITMTTTATSIKWARTHTVLKKNRITALQAAIESVEGI